MSVNVERPPIPRRRRYWSPWWPVVGVLALLGGLFGRFSYSSICGDCGMTRESVDWQIPLIGIPYWWTHQTAATPISRVVQARGLGGPHRWLFCGGGGNGISCAIGPGRHLSWAVRSQDTAAFVASVDRCYGPAEARQWLALILDPKASDAVVSVVDGTGVPAGGFATAVAFEPWWAAHADDLSSLRQSFPSLKIHTPPAPKGPASSSPPSGPTRP